ncbi:MAG: hypothetical protein IPM39_25065 [Chloroflexi bacterium]|nr:hypothetical protein [Chloroflexota bacterium]
MNILTDYDAFTTEYDEMQELAQMKPIPPQNNITYETLRSHYKPLSLRERVEIQRREEAAKHQARYGSNKTASKGLKMLEKARKEAEQPKQLRLF